MDLKPGKEPAAIMSQLDKAGSFVFACSSRRKCFNQCCANLELPLTPYDVLRLAFAMACTDREVLQKYAHVEIDPCTGLPQAWMRMREQAEGRCPFVAEGGCRVYAHRPGACRAFPLGRGASLERNGIGIRYYLIREPFCDGFGHGQEWLPENWLESQKLAPYNRSNDRLMRLIAMIRASGAPLDSALQKMAWIALFDSVAFEKILVQHGLLAMLDLPPRRAVLVLQKNLEGREAALDLAMSWLELRIFGCAPDLALLDRR